jgi:ankyrin repeat protein
LFQELVEVLLKHGADVHKELGPSRNKCTPLMVAAYSGDLEICKLLVKHGAIVEAKGGCKIHFELLLKIML